ncbi:hypothetical protein D3C87_2106510 [compost metagenome]
MVANFQALAVLEHRLQRGQAVQRGIGPVALVAGQGDGLRGGLAGGAVRHLLDGGERHDLFIEAAGGLGGGGALL